MKKIVSTLIAGLMAFSLVVMGCSNDSSSDNTALMLLVSASSASSGSSGSGSSGGTKPAGGAVNALSGAQAGATVDLSEYELSDKIALKVDKAITVKNAILNGGYITVSEEATLDNVDGGTIVLVGNGKNATLKDCDAKNVIVKEAEGSRGASDFTLKINGGVVENIVNDGLNLTIKTTKTTIKKLITKQSLVINSTEESKIELISASAQITLAGKLVIEKAVSENTVKVASNTVSIKKGNVEIVADDSEYAEDNLNIETIKAAVGELTDSESKEISNTLEAVQKEAEEMNSNIQAAEDEANKALEEYKKAVVTFYLVDEGQVLHEENVPLAEVEKALETLTASIPEGGKIELFSDEACTKPVDVKTIKAGDKIYIKVSGDIHDEPVIPGEYVTVYYVEEGKVSHEEKVPLAAVEKVLESMTAGGKIELFSDEACTKPVEVKNIKAGDKIYIKVSGDIHDEPVIPGECVTFYVVYEGQVLPDQRIIPFAEVEKALEALTASIPEGGKIEFFSDEACTTPVDVETIKAGDTIYIKVLIPGGVVTVYFVDEGEVSPGQKVPLTAVEKYLEDMTASIPEGGKIEFFSDEACTTPVDVKDIKDGDKIYIKVSGDIHDEPVIPGEYVTFYEVYEGQVSPERKVPLAALENFLEGMTAGMPAGVEIGLFSDEACTTPVDVETIKAGDIIYIKYPEYSDLPDVPGEPDVDLPVVIVNGENVPLYTMIADLEDGQLFYINGEVNMENADAWLPMMGNVFIFTYNENMNAWKSETGSVKVNMTRNAAENPYEKGVKVDVWDKSENISFSDKDTAIILNGLVQGKMYALVMTNSTNDYNTDGKGKHVELYEVVMGE